MSKLIAVLYENSYFYPCNVSITSLKWFAVRVEVGSWQLTIHHAYYAILIAAFCVMLFVLPN